MLVGNESENIPTVVHYFRAKDTPEVKFKLEMTESSRVYIGLSPSNHDIEELEWIASQQFGCEVVYSSTAEVM